MRFWPFLFLFLLLGCHSDDMPNWITYQGGNPYIETIGRFDFSEKEHPKVWAPGAYIRFYFQGTSCDVTILDEMRFGTMHNYISIIVDGGKPRRMRLDEVENVIHVAKGIKKGKHEVVICKNTESNIGFIQLENIQCRKLVKNPNGKKPIIEFIGDSITCGNGCDLSEKTCEEGTWYDQHNAYASYGPRVARALNADYFLSAVSGIGLTKSCCGTPYTMPDIYDYINFSLDGEKWNHTNYHPALVCITLGQNDGLQKPEIFVKRYVLFVQRIHQYYPNATIVICASSMANEPLKKYHANYLPRIVDLVQKKGINRVYAFQYKGKYRGGCKHHPTLEEHQRIANELLNFLKKI
jgi:hypothetical protein